jgi:citrate synthase
MKDGNKGLDGVTAALSAVSSIMDDALTYRGYDIEELARESSFEEVSYLLWYGELPTSRDLNLFSGNLRSRRNPPPQVLRIIQGFPPAANPMAGLRTAVSALALYDPPTNDGSAEPNLERAMRLLATIPTIVAAIYRTREGLAAVPPDPTLNEAENFLASVNGEPPVPRLARVLNTARILHADHELNASTFTARVAASTLAGMDAAVVAALSTLEGRLHGGAGAAVMHMLEDIGDEANVAPYLDAALRRRDRIMGFGHRVYAGGDPRATVLKQLSADLARQTGDSRWYDVSRTLEERMREQTGLRPNVDFYAASVYTYMGIPPYLFTPLFAMSRVSGWIAHILEQYDNNRLIRPRAEYVGVGARPYLQLHER